jgi:beta-hydroxylase
MGLFILAIFVLCSVYVQTRGAVRHATLTRRLTDHSNLMSPINCLFYGFSRIKKSAFIDPTLFPELKVLQDNWQLIRDEAMALNNDARIKASDDLDDLGFNSFFKTGWKRFYLKWYGASLKSAQRFAPQTVQLLESIPSVKAAMFASLPPGASLCKHRDPYAGSLRYHLGLVTPNSDDCYIIVDGQKYAWRDGEAVMFDETFIHYAQNHTDNPRIVLFLDIKRPVNFFLVDWLNSFLSRFLLAEATTKNMQGDKVGILNKAFGYVYQVRIVGKKLKAFNRTLYYTIEYTLYAALLYWIFIA